MSKTTKAARILAAFDHLLAAGLIDEAAGLTMHMSKRNASKAWRRISGPRG